MSIDLRNHFYNNQQSLTSFRQLNHIKIIFLSTICFNLSLISLNPSNFKIKINSCLHVPSNYNKLARNNHSNILHLSTTTFSFLKYLFLAFEKLNFRNYLQNDHQSSSWKISNIVYLEEITTLILYFYISTIPLFISKNIFKAIYNTSFMTVPSKNVRLKEQNIIKNKSEN